MFRETDEAVFLKAPQHQPGASAVEDQQLDPVMFSVVKSKHGTSKWIQLHALLDQYHQAVDARPEIDWLPMQGNPEVGIKAKHHHAPNAATITLTSSTSHPENSSSNFALLGN